MSRVIATTYVQSQHKVFTEDCYHKACTWELTKLYPWRCALIKIQLFNGKLKATDE